MSRNQASVRPMTRSFLGSRRQAAVPVEDDAAWRVKVGQQYCLTRPLTPSTGEDPGNECRRYAAAHGLARHMGYRTPAVTGRSSASEIAVARPMTADPIVMGGT